MAIYTVHEPVEAANDFDRADRTVFIREGFTFRAFLFGSLYLLWHRLWFALLAWLIFAAGLFALVTAAGISPGVCVLLGLLGRLFLGVEGNDLRRWALGRRGLRFVQVVAGADRSAAELSFFKGQDLAEAEPRVPPARWSGAPDPTPAVIGMFPDGGRL